MNWRKYLKGKTKLKEPLKKHTTFKIGGPADFFFEPKDEEDLKSLLLGLKKYRIPFKIIGAGSNILAGDNRLPLAVLRLSSAFFKRVEFKGKILEAGSGASLGRLIRFAQARGLSGLEFLSGIPASLGGAIAMNAGWKGKGIADVIKEVTVMDHQGNVKRLDKKQIRFTYRNADLSKYIILRALLRLSSKDKRRIREAIRKNLIYRRQTQDLSAPSAGCIFKNPPGASAGKLIDLCGLKGKKAGGARVSSKHANFILNSGDARAGDVLNLMSLISRKVKNKFGVGLKPEIKIWR
ncbi:MAG: UDP-N-acetylmuramate dehydrogenase [Candidatus Omnitrophica bacterium]|nr:UDP-N-acetylmuramate dehydrogenase [Candidatus Omnitrophota bacterium]